MEISKHAYARFKQRQNIKSESEMMRRLSLAIERGTPLLDVPQQPGTTCYEFAGYQYIVSDEKQVLITVIQSKHRTRTKRSHLIEQLQIKQTAIEANQCLATI